MKEKEYTNWDMSQKYYEKLAKLHSRYIRNHPDVGWTDSEVITALIDQVIDLEKKLEHPYHPDHDVEGNDL
jgi:hypothetical protein